MSAEPEPIAPAPSGPLGPGVLPAAVETASGRRFVLGDRVHDPRAEEAIASFLASARARCRRRGPSRTRMSTR